MIGDIPEELLRKGMDESLFLKFALRCTRMVAHRIEAMGGDDMLCSHPENKFIHTFKGPAGAFSPLPQCFLRACPIYERLKLQTGDQQQFDEYLRRLESLKGGG